MIGSAHRLLTWFGFIAAVFSGSGCTLVQINEKKHVLLKTETAVQQIDKTAVGARLTSVNRNGERTLLHFSVFEKISRTERRTFAETRRIERSLLHDGKFRYFVGWISFAFETDGADKYPLYIVGGVPLTLGINVPLAIGDWLSLPFRLRDETTQDEVNEDKIVSKTERMVADCSEFEIFIYRQKFALPPDCRLNLENAEFMALATKHPHLPHFEGTLRYELAQKKDGMILMNGQIFLKKLTGTPQKIEFIERP